MTIEAIEQKISFLREKYKQYPDKRKTILIQVEYLKRAMEIAVARLPPQTHIDLSESKNAATT